MTERLKADIEADLRQAGLLDQKSPPMKGVCSAETLEELKAGSCSNSEAIAATPAAVEAFFYQATAAAEEAWKRDHMTELARTGVLPPYSTTLQVVWERGTLTAASGFTNMPARELRRPRQAAIDVEVASAAVALTPAAREPSGAMQDFES